MPTYPCSDNRGGRLSPQNVVSSGKLGLVLLHPINRFRLKSESIHFVKRLYSSPHSVKYPVHWVGRFSMCVARRHIRRYISYWIGVPLPVEALTCDFVLDLADCQSGGKWSEKVKSFTFVSFVYNVVERLLEARFKLYISHLRHWYGNYTWIAELFQLIGLKVGQPI